MNAKKKILAVALAASMAVLAVGGSSLAYFTDTDSADNVFTVGNVQIDLKEPTWDAEEDHQYVYPGEPLAKDPKVENIGSNPALIRVKLTGANGENDIVETRVGNSNSGRGQVYDEWILRDDGYYYYYAPLAADDTTKQMFDYIVLQEFVTNDGHATDWTENVKVEVQAVQAQGVFPSYNGAYGDGIDESEWEVIENFFDNAFNASAEPIE